MSCTPRRRSRPWRDAFWAALKREPDVVETLAGPIRSLEILAGLLAPIQSGTGGIVSVRSTSGLDRSSPDAALRRRGVRAGATCMKACDDVQSPSGLAVSIWVTICKVPAAAVIIWTATGSAPGGLLLWKTGIVHSGFGVLFLAVLAGTKR